MPIVHFINEQKSIEIREGRTIARAAHDAGVHLETPCSGAGSCGKCKVKVSDTGSLRLLQSIKKLTDEEKRNNIVLACQSRVYDDVDVYTLQSGAHNASLQILNEGMRGQVELCPAISKEHRQNITSVYSIEGILGEEEGNTTENIYGVTMDIGTTTLVCALIDCTTGNEVCSVSEMNPQCVYAQDVVSRIQYTAQNKDGLKTMFEDIRNTFNKMIHHVCEAAAISATYIYEIVFSGNTTMLHLATNTDPFSLGQYPYTSQIAGNCYFSAKELGLEISAFGRVYLPPVISAYVGADITSGILVSNLKELKGCTLFIDIGTNGEMVMAKDGDMIATSTAAGPAFEGMNISFGMRAGNGAIESFEIDDDMQVHVKTIGNEKATGICGSGLFDIAGELVRIGIIDKTGKFVKEEKCTLPEQIKSHLKKYNGKPAFEVADEVYLTALDIRQVQLAKSAIRAGIEAMLAMNRVTSENIDRVYIAGSFGYHLKARSLVEIGIIPRELEEKLEFIGNTSKTGGTYFLLDASKRADMERQVKNIESLELSDYENFENLFVKCMTF